MPAHVRARTPGEAYTVCRPEVPLQADDERFVKLDEFRGKANTLAETFVQAIAPGGQMKRCKGYVAGHRGCGKTSELFRLQADLKSRGFIVAYCDIENTLGLSDIDSIDVLIQIAECVAQLVEDRTDFDQELLAALNEFFDEITIERKEDHKSEVNLQTGAQIGGGLLGIGKLFAKFTAGVKAGSAVTKTVRQNLALRFDDFRERLDALIREARQLLGNKEIVVIVDGLEKVAYQIVADNKSNYSILFVEHSDRLNAPDCHIIYTLPISLAYDENISDRYTCSYVMPMIDYKKSDAQKALRQVLGSRIELATVFDTPESAVEMLIIASGGCLRDLMRLVQIAATAQNEKILDDRCKRSIEELSKDYDRLYRSTDLPLLEAVYKGDGCDGSGRAGELLHNRVVLEYENGSRRIEIHPAILNTPRLRKYLIDEGLLQENLGV